MRRDDITGRFFSAGQRKMPQSPMIIFIGLLARVASNAPHRLVIDASGHA